MISVLYNKLRSSAAKLDWVSAVFRALGYAIRSLRNWITTPSVSTVRAIRTDTSLRWKVLNVVTHGWLRHSGKLVVWTYKEEENLDRTETRRTDPWWGTNRPLCCMQRERTKLAWFIWAQKFMETHLVGIWLLFLLFKSMTHVPTVC